MTLLLYEFWKKHLSILFLIIIISSLMLPVTAFAGESLTIAGTGSALESMKILGQAFEKSHPGIKIKIIPSLGSSGGIKAVSRKAIDIAISSRTLNNEERMFGLSVIEYARSPLIFITNPNVPVSNVTSEDIIKIYNGVRTTWPDGQRIRVPLRQRNEIDIQIVTMISSEISQAIDIALSRPGIFTAVTDQDNAEMIEKTAGAFGISTLTQVLAEKRSVKILSYNGITPSIKHLASGSYPLTRPYFTVTQKDLSVPARNFLAFMRSIQGKKILKTTGNYVIIQ
ncbi:MAG: substrate-binding domain-containing protein [Smithellaceae bacterium]